MPSFSLILIAIAQSLALFLLLILGLRLMGERILTQLSIEGYLVIALLGSAVESALWAGSRSISAGIAAATTILLADKAISILIRRSNRVRNLLVGDEIVLVHDGQLARDELKRCRLTKTDVMAALRKQGHDKLDHVKYAVLEADGTISVIDDQSFQATPAYEKTPTVPPNATRRE